MHQLMLLLGACAAICVTATAAVAGPAHGPGRHVGAPGVYAGAGYRPFYPGYRPFYPAYRPIYPGWGAGYWGPRAGFYVGGPVYSAGWPYAWGAGYGVPYAVAPAVVFANPAAQVFVQQEPLAAAPASTAPDSSYWYYCTQPAGYFPYVQDCSAAWMKVVPQVPGAHTTPPRLAP